MIDQVLSHTSDQHAWFQESRRDRDNPRADWYVMGRPEARWHPQQLAVGVRRFRLAVDSRRQQYYLHNFWSSNRI